MNIATLELFGYIILGEMIGAMFLVFLGNSISSMNSFKNTSGYKTGWLFNNIGWGMADAIGLLFSMIIESIGTTLVHNQTGLEVHFIYGLINPAFSTSMLIGGIWASDIGWIAAFIMYILCIFAQVFGAMIGQVFVDIIYWKYFKTADLNSIKLVHCTQSKDRNAWGTNMFTQFAAASTIISVGVIICGFETRSIGSNLWIPFLLGMTLLVVRSAVGSSAFASNPARDLGPRIIFAILPLSKFGISKKEQLKQVDPVYTFFVPFLAPMLAGVFIGAWCWLIPEFHEWYDQSEYIKNPYKIFSLKINNFSY